MMITNKLAIVFVKGIFRRIIDNKSSENEKNPIIDKQFIPELQAFVDTVESEKDFIQWYWHVTSQHYLESARRELDFSETADTDDDAAAAAGPASSDFAPLGGGLPRYRVRLQLMKLRF